MNGDTVILSDAKTKDLEVQGQIFKVGKLSYKQTFAFLKWLGVVSITVKNAFGNADPTATDDKQDIEKVLASVDEGMGAQFFQIALSRRGNPEVTLEFVQELSLEEMTAIFAEMLEANDWEVILKNAQRAGDILRRIVAVFTKAPTE